MWFLSFHHLVRQWDGQRKNVSQVGLQLEDYQKNSGIVRYLQ
jgi:hypothetical protein